MDLRNYLGKTINIKIDRPAGSIHPKYKNLIYPINYGFVPGTKNNDDEEIDVYILGTDKPLKKYQGKVIAVIHRLNDDDKLIVSYNRKKFSDKEIDQKIKFQEKYFKYIIIRKRLEN